MRRGVWATAIAVGLIAAGCSSGSDPEVVASSEVATTISSATTATNTPTTTVVETTTVVGSTTSEADASTSLPADPAPFTETSDLVYRTIDGVELLMDVFTPAGDGPWPVVVSFHGLSNSGKDIRDTVVVAEEAATRGMVVFTPTWIAGDPFPITIETVETWDDTVSCAVSFAQQNAAEYGGDPTKTVVDGFSAGAGAALLFSSQDPRVDPIAGCATDASPTAITGFVIGDVESWLHSQNFDGAFEADLEAMQVRLATLIDPTSWPPHPDAEFFLWVAAEGTNPRTIGDPSDVSGWFAQRDPEGLIQADLESLDQFADGVVTYVDAGQLLDLRLSRAGLNVSLDEYPGGHTTQNKVTEIVGYLQAAVDG